MRSDKSYEIELHLLEKQQKHAQKQLRRQRTGDVLLYLGIVFTSIAAATVSPWWYLSLLFPIGAITASADREQEIEQKLNSIWIDMHQLQIKREEELEQWRREMLQ